MIYSGRCICRWAGLRSIGKKSNQIQFHCNQLLILEVDIKTHSRTTSLRILHVGNLLVQLEMRPPDARTHYPQPTTNPQHPASSSQHTDRRRPTDLPTDLLDLSHLRPHTSLRSMWKHEFLQILCSRWSVK